MKRVFIDSINSNWHFYCRVYCGHFP